MATTTPSTEKKPTPEKTLTPPAFHQRAEDYKAFYFNHAQVGATPFDIFMILGEASADAIHAGGIVEQRARVTTSPAEALLLAKFLINAVKDWQRKTGQKVIDPTGQVSLEELEGLVK